MTRRIGAVALLACSALLLAACSDDGSSSAPPPTPLPPASTAAPNPGASTGRSELLPSTRVSTADVPLMPFGPAGDGTTLWYWDDGTGKVVSIDTATGKAGTPITVSKPGGTPYGSPKTVAVGSSGVWAANARRHTLDRIDPATSAIAERIPLKPPSSAKLSKAVTPYGLAVDGASLWTTDFDQGVLLQVNATSGKVTRVVKKLGHPAAVATGFGSVWVYEYREGIIARVDPATGKVVKRIEVQNSLGSGPCGGCGDNIAVGSDALWFPLGNGFGVARIDPTTNAVTATIPLTIVVNRAFADDSGVWVAGGSGTRDQNAVVLRIDPSTAQVNGRLAVPYAIDAAVAPAGGDVWVGTAQTLDAGTVVRVHLGE